MSNSLADALRRVDLQAGQVYQYQIGRFRVEVRVEEAPPLLPAPLESADVMLDPWIDLPAAKSIAVIQAAPGPPVLPDLPTDVRS